MKKRDMVLDMDNVDIILIVTKQPLEAWLSMQVSGKATSIGLTLDQAGHLINNYWAQSLPVFQQWRAEHEGE